MEFFLAINSFTKNQSSNDRFPSNKHRFFYEIQRILLLTCSTFKPLYPGAESDPQPSTRFLQPGQCIAFNPCGIVLRCDTVFERLVILVTFSTPTWRTTPSSTPSTWTTTPSSTSSPYFSFSTPCKKMRALRQLPKLETRHPRIGAAVRPSNPMLPSAYALMSVSSFKNYLTYTFPRPLILSIICVG